MKAVRLLEYGGPLVFQDVPTPTIARDITSFHEFPINPVHKENVP